jgi:hypothetical protein
VLDHFQITNIWFAESGWQAKALHVLTLESLPRDKAVEDTRKWAEAMVDEEDSGNTDTVLLGTCQTVNILQKAIDVCGPDTKPEDIGISGVSSNCRIFEMINESDQKACHMETSPSVGGRNTGGKKFVAGERGRPDQGEYMVE